MSGESLYNNGIRLVGRVRNNQGIVLLVTLVILVVLSTLGYTVSVRLSARRHRDQYIIDYQTARYACDSAVKYALATLQDIHGSVMNYVQLGDPTPFKAFRYNEYRTTV